MIDTHTHIYLEEFDEDRIEVVRRAREAGVERVILPNVDFDTVQAMHATNDLFPGYCRMAMGLHPTSVEADYRERLEQVRELLFSGEYCAVGEIGLAVRHSTKYRLCCSRAECRHSEGCSTVSRGRPNRCVC